MRINTTEEKGKEGLKGLIELTKENKYKEIQKEILKEVFKE